MTQPSSQCPSLRRAAAWPGLLLPSLLCLSCARPAPLTVDMPLHLEDHVDAATITGSDLPANPAQPVEWRFNQPQPDWKATPAWNPPFGKVTLARSSEGLGITLTERSQLPDGRLRGGIHVPVPAWDRREWGEVVIRARADSASGINFIGLGFNLREGRGGRDSIRAAFQSGGQSSPVVRDGAVNTYRLRVAVGSRGFRGPWRELALWVGSDSAPGSIEVLSVSVVPTEAAFADSSRGVRPLAIGESTRRALYTHAPGRFSYRLRAPEHGRLDAALGVIDDNVPVTFRVMVRASGTDTTLLEERHADPERWAQRSVSLERYAGRTVTLSLDAVADRPGTVALWGAPTVSGDRRSAMPNVILYVIDGGGADYMSIYGYNRRTTPNLERLAAEGAMFEHAYSNAGSTKPSTASFMTSLHPSVLGLSGNQPQPLPQQAVTMAEHFHRAGYQTAVLTANPNASTVTGLERGVDLVPPFRVQNDAESSVKLHQAFWTWRAESPGQPYWVHFQSTDVHAVSRNTLELYEGIPVAPFGGLFVSAEEVDTLREWSRRVVRTGGRRSAAFTTGGISRVTFFTLLQGMWDQQMAHNDYQLGRLVERLKASGEWQNTVLIVTADHSIAGSFTDTRLGMLQPRPPAWSGGTFRPTVSRVPLLIVWPGHIAGGQRFEEPVSLIDLLPTVLELAGLPLPEVLQGRSLAPLLLGDAGWTPRPVIFDSYGRNPQTGQLQGRVEVVDGRWAASLWIGPPPADTLERRPWPLLLYDLWNDPLVLQPDNERRPDLVTQYTRFLEDHWRANQALATRFRAGAPVVLSPDQLERLRALGYIR